MAILTDAAIALHSPGCLEWSTDGQRFTVLPRPAWRILSAYLYARWPHDAACLEQELRRGRATSIRLSSQLELYLRPQALPERAQ